MKREYTYENATVSIIFPDNFQQTGIHKATEIFLRRVLVEEQSKNGNSHTSRTIDKE